MNHKDAEERWKLVVGYEGRYSVSDLGRMRSWTRTENCPASRSSRRPYTRVRHGRVLKLGKGSSGYLLVNLCKDSAIRSVSVHRMVCRGFLGACVPARTDMEVLKANLTKGTFIIRTVEPVSGGTVYVENAYRGQFVLI